MNINVRSANDDDIDIFKEVIRVSILELCKDYYTPKEIGSLLAQYPNRTLYEKWMNERVLVVAEHAGRIVGFGQYYPPNNSLEAVHVLPSATKSGVGRLVVAKIEEIAKAQGANLIILVSSLNAVEFYVNCGYIKKESSWFKCNDGAELEVVNFEKEINR